MSTTNTGKDASVKESLGEEQAGGRHHHHHHRRRIAFNPRNTHYMYSPEGGGGGENETVMASVLCFRVNQITVTFVQGITVEYKLKTRK